MHRSRVAYFVIDVDDLDRAVTFWSAALDAAEEPGNPASRHVLTVNFGCPTYLSESCCSGRMIPRRARNGCI